MYSIEKLGEICGVSRRTVRYYIQRGLLSPPEGKLKGAYYTEKHVKRLEEIKNLSQKGVSLNMMKGLFANELSLHDIPGFLKNEQKSVLQSNEADKNIWVHLNLADGVKLQIRKDRADKLNLSDLETRIINQIRGCYNDQ